MASADPAARVAACHALSDPARPISVVGAMVATLATAPTGPARAALVNDLAAKSRLTPDCGPESDGWADVAFTHPVAARVALGLLG
jgi:hypothetical protein